MADYTFFHNPMSRGQIARWALHEAGADYATAIVDWQHKPAALLAANPMGKVPTIIHHATGGAPLNHERVVSEAAAICAYLAEMHPAKDLLPREAEKADYFRWMFFTAGPIEAAITASSMGFDPGPDKQAMAGWGSLERTVRTIEQHMTGRDYVCGARFTMADVYVGSAIDWGLTFGSIPPQPSLVAYAERMQARPAYVAAKTIDNGLIQEMRK
jgi:glutathione S-transferase